ncbi:beta-mannanase [Streptomyces cocklensis]|uniref:Glycosyl hydrolase family 26 n=1 Tax=Actinacidiphila cocklensis TaxID=887465 RepID=A0A9W4DSE0_9ACTN|nr:glycosyl hydrolase [Actinacidiphila cocklensis]MDD1064075.1 beta-mannanase [Actinacidiphila cocklensis]CAG6395201.1 Glycosyl hydrolase family 26 [Actinacidiphila cocklensis]
MADGGDMPEPRRGARRLVQAALAVTAAVAVGLGAFALGGGSSGGSGKDHAGRSVALPSTRTTETVPDKSRFLRPPGGTTYVGVAAPDAPWKSAVLSGIAEDAGGVRPDMVEYFVNWTKGFDEGAVRSAYSQHALPVITWEPWAGAGKGTKQPSYALSTIIDGRHDAYITAFAEAVKAGRWPVAIRFGHEMNGHWYPWAEHNGVNKPGQFAAAWKHVHAIFDKVGADNVIWVWAPNTLRGADPVRLASLYPGDAYVDWIGMSAYGVSEAAAGDTLDPTLRAVRKFTQRPLLITETGSQPGARKAGWIASFFPWLRKHPDVIGFVWFQYTREQGAGADWTFTSSTAARNAFRTGVRTLKPAAVPAPS